MDHVGSDVSGSAAMVSYMKDQIINNEIISFDPLISNLKNSLWKMRTQNSTSIDIIAVYLKGQKTLYIESKAYCEGLLYRVMLPAIAISSVCTVLSLALASHDYGSIIVASLTALNSFLLAVISYLKLDAKAESYRVSAYRFDKLQTRCEFFSGKLLFSDRKAVVDVSGSAAGLTIEGFLDQLEKDVIEIKEVNQFTIPRYVRNKLPKLYTTNVFAELKRRGNAQRLYIYDLNIVYNRLAELMASPSGATLERQAEINALTVEKDALMLNYIRARDSYLTIDQELTNEINSLAHSYSCSDRFLCRGRSIKPEVASRPQYETDMETYLAKRAKPKTTDVTVDISTSPVQTVSSSSGCMAAYRQ
jgi:hypothetical protein